jgi:zinc ribbon protein
VICPQCRATNESGSAFCRNCGTSLAGQAPAPEAGPQGSFRPAPPSAPTAGRRGAPGGPAASGDPRMPADRSPAGVPSPAGAFRLDIHRLTRVDQTVAIASLIVFVALFLPWYGFSELGASFSISGTSAHGYLVIALIMSLLLIGYLVLRSGWERFPVELPIAHAPLLLIGTGLQFLLVLIGFLDKPAAGLDWEIGAYLALIAAAAAAAPVVIPAVRSWQENR